MENPHVDIVNIGYNIGYYMGKYYNIILYYDFIRYPHDVSIMPPLLSRPISCRSRALRGVVEHRWAAAQCLKHKRRRGRRWRHRQETKESSMINHGKLG